MTKIYKNFFLFTLIGTSFFWLTDGNAQNCRNPSGYEKCVDRCSIGFDRCLKEAAPATIAKVKICLEKGFRVCSSGCISRCCHKPF